MNSMMRRFLIIIFILAILGLKLTAQKIVTDRPDQTESSTTIPVKSLQIESGFLAGYTNNNNISERQLLFPTTLFRYGLLRYFELRIVEQIERIKSDQPSYTHFGLSDLELGIKIQILKKETINTEITFLSHLILPTGQNGLTNHKPGTSSKIAVSHSINDFLGIGYNIGYDYFGIGNGDLTYSVSLGARVTQKIGSYTEIYGQIAEFRDMIYNFDSGLTYLIQDNLQLDLSFGIGLNQKMNYFSIGCSWNICHGGSN